MSIVKRFITESIKRTEIDEYLQKNLTALDTAA